MAKARDHEPAQLAVSRARNGGSLEVVTASFENYDADREPAMRPSPFQAFVRVMMGCDKFCTYCIVPAVRGPEQSRPPAAILAEARLLADQGVKEITLLGQTVNSYQYQEPDGRSCRLSDLLARIHDIAGIERIKFITNFPNDMTDDLLQAVRDFPKVSRYLHVPAQSGCDAILKRMKRMYTVAFYEEMLARVRETMPDVAVSSDFIVGFCGEDEAVVRADGRAGRAVSVQEQLYLQVQSPAGDQGRRAVCRRRARGGQEARNNELLALQNAISLEDNRRWVGRTVLVLVEGASREGGSPRWLGRSRPVDRADRMRPDRGVRGSQRLIGRFVRIVVEDASAVTLFGRVETSERIATPA